MQACTFVVLSNVDIPVTVVFHQHQHQHPFPKDGNPLSNCKYVGALANDIGPSTVVIMYAKLKHDMFVIEVKRILPYVQN